MFARHKSALFPISLLLAMGLAPRPLPAETAPQSPIEWVRKAVHNEVRSVSDDSRLFRYVLKKENNSGTSVHQMVEMKDGILARTLEWNGRTLTAEEREKEKRKLQALIDDPEERKRKFREQNDDAQRVLRLLRALPDALLYTFDGNESMDGRDTLRLRFTPNPRYSGNSKETYALRAASGMIWIDTADARVARFDATLTDDINLGFGLLGRINRGGHMLLEQKVVGEDQWRIVRLDIDASGKVFLFKSIRIKQHQQGSDYQPVPQMTLADAVQFLKQG